jgi:hypothetical protein
MTVLLGDRSTDSKMVDESVIPLGFYLRPEFGD